MDEVLQRARLVFGSCLGTEDPERDVMRGKRVDVRMFGPDDSNNFKLNMAPEQEGVSVREVDLSSPSPTDSPSSFYDDHLPIKYILGDAILLKSFFEFTEEQHSNENLLFWQAVEAFTKHRYTRPNEELKAILEQADATARKKKSNVADTRMHMNFAQKFKLPMARVGVILDALKIYEVFLQDGARMWVFITPKVRTEISKILLKEPEKTKQGIFAKAAHEAYVTMEKDMLPRFLDLKRDNPVIRERVAHYAQIIRDKRPTLAESIKRQSVTFLKHMSSLSGRSGQSSLSGKLSHFSAPLRALSTRMSVRRSEPQNSATTLSPTNATEVSF